MEANLKSQIIAAFIGGFITYVVGWAIDWHKDQRKTDALLKIGLTATRDDLQHSINEYSRLIDDYAKNNIVSYDTIYSILTSRITLYKMRELLPLVNNKHIREQIFQYYSKSDVVLNSLHSYQKRINELLDLFAEQRLKLKSKRNFLTEDNIQKELSNKFPKEYHELHNLTFKLIPDQINELKECKTTAMFLLNTLSDDKIIYKN